MHNIFITGIAGFIGFHLAEKLTLEGYEVSGLDNFNDYYDTKLKDDRAKILLAEYGIKIHNLDLKDVHWESLHLENYDAVIHLAAYAGVRHSLENPQMYIDNNITGTQRLIQELEEIRDIPEI